MATLLYILKTKMELPYDYSLSHHQLLFNIFICLCGKYGNIFSKNKQNDIFTYFLT
jgi:hypothetical protein